MTDQTAGTESELELLRKGAQTAISFLGPSMYIAVNRRLSMFEPNVDTPVSEQIKNLLNDLKILQCAGDLLISRFTQIR